MATEKTVEEVTVKAVGEVTARREVIEKAEDEAVSLVV